MGPGSTLLLPPAAAARHLILDLAVEMFLSLVERLRRIAELRDGFKSTTWLRCRPRICDRHKTLCETGGVEHVNTRRAMCAQHAGASVPVAGFLRPNRFIVPRSSTLRRRRGPRTTPPTAPGARPKGTLADLAVSLSLYFLGAMRWWRVEGGGAKGRGGEGMAAAPSMPTHRQHSRWSRASC
eukprot:scaffold19279_cov83-Isochrysis_galbana.AAC.2